MTGTSDGDLDDGRDGATGEAVAIKCTADPVGDGLDVDWTRGAIFEFETLSSAERWLEAQNARVVGTLFLARVPAGESALPVDYYVKYSGG